MEKVKILLLTSRPILWLGPVFIYIAGMMVVPTPWTLKSLAGLLFVTWPMGVIVYGLNDIADRSSDLNNPRKGRVEGYIPRTSEFRLIEGSVTAMLALSILLMLLLKWYLGAVLTLGIFLFSYLYSYKPVRLKSRPLMDSLSNGLWMLLVFLLGYSVSLKSFTEFTRLPEAAWWIFLGVVAAHAISTLVDYEEDKIAGDKTIGLLLTKRGTLLVSFLLYLAIYILLPSLPGALLIKYYIILTLSLVGIMFVYPVKKVLHWCTWVIFLAFPVVCLYLLVFEKILVIQLLSYR